MATSRARVFHGLTAVVAVVARSCSGRCPRSGPTCWPGWRRSD